jgi:hypothetical protein
MEALDQIIEIMTSILFLVIGLWGTAFAYGVVGREIVGGFHWRPAFQRPLRWLGPLLVLLCVASLVVLLK